jgi:hypothetical protein
LIIASPTSSIVQTPPGKSARLIGYSQPGKRLREIQREIIRNMPVISFLHPDRRNSQTKKTGVVSCQLRLDWREVEKIGMADLLQFGVRPSERPAEVMSLKPVIESVLRF